MAVETDAGATKTRGELSHVGEWRLLIGGGGSFFPDACGTQAATGGGWATSRSESELVLSAFGPRSLGAPS